MARDVDTIINFIKQLTYIPPVHKQVMINRLQTPPSKEELDAARAVLYPDIKNLDPWKESNG